MNLSELRAYINKNIGPNGEQGIDGSEMKTALLELCERIEASTNWTPFFALATNGPYLVVKITDWQGGQGVKPPVNVYLGTNGAYVTDINLAVNIRGAQGPQGLPGNGVLSGVTTPADGKAGTQYYPVMELPAATQGTYDFADIELVSKPWDAGNGTHTHTRLYIANRGSFTYEYTLQGFVDGVGLEVYRVADGRAIVYIKTDNSFRAFAVRVTNHLLATVYGELVYQAGAPGNSTLMVSTLDPKTYKPLSITRTRFSSFASLNSDGLFPAVISDLGSAQLSLGANYVAGASDLAVISSNLASNGISFWQMVTATTKRLLAYLNANGDFAIGTATPAEKFHVEGNAYISGILKFAAAVGLRKIALHPGSNNDHQFYGFGIAASTLRYQVDAATSKHLFSAGLTPATSKTLMVIQGDGKVGIGMDSPSNVFHVAADNPTAGIIAEFQNNHGASGTSGVMLQIHQTGVAIWRFGQPPGVDAFVINGWAGGAYPERMRIDANGNVGIGTQSPTSRMHLKSDTGVDQLRLETRYTPNGSGDANGQPGNITWDGEYLYCKTQYGWRRANLYGF
ncbi:hypothetical protein [Spirosoma oryzicola]|uniref:hypothetical protein n=1 Tax=Spirosoma oryzicola TaxID=2898794 RepID=UPI001E32B9E6|nr:hypothetical protein [Spirosoma oryzicola]UHG91761.1 hypothetical protein LQ777_02415 [Spirosoma oryzicola]